MAACTKANVVTRIISLGLWPVAFVFVWLDSSALDNYDFGLLFGLTACGCLAAIAGRRWIRWSVAAIFLAVNLFAVLSYGPILRSAGNNHQQHENDFHRGVAAFYDAVIPFRPYVIVATIGLFAIAVISYRRDKNIGA